ncbi:MAG TPA: sigma-70 family RNA polymerase sigma factor [Pyrinomonadaceae bacterium]|jgi:RNA polymerase sigma factor (sigma-70 family)
MFQTDEELIERARGGSEAAWESIVYKYQNLLFSIPLRAGLRRDLAADVLQEVFTTLFQKIETLEKPEFLRAWLVTTTQHKTIHLIHRETRGRPKSIDELESSIGFEVLDPQALPDESLIQIEQEKQIEDALAAIDERCRRLLTLLYLSQNQVPYAEIARMLDIPLGSIGPTRARCLEKLIKLLPK